MDTGLGPSSTHQVFAGCGNQPVNVSQKRALAGKFVRSGAGRLRMGREQFRWVAGTIPPDNCNILWAERPNATALAGCRGKIHAILALTVSEGCAYGQGIPLSYLRRYRASGRQQRGPRGVARVRPFYHWRTCPRVARDPARLALLPEQGVARPAAQWLCQRLQP